MGERGGGFFGWVRAHPLLTVGAVGLALWAGTQGEDSPTPTAPPTAVAAEPVTDTAEQAEPEPARQHESEPVPEPEPEPKPHAPVLLRIADEKDGDSFVTSDGREIRLGLVNTPELGEPCSAQAARFTRAFLANGFTVEPYSRDTHGRVVAEVRDPRGRSLNVALARSGLGNDRYLEEFRHENPHLARRLDAAFAQARTPACAQREEPRPLVAAPAPSKDCHPDYATCIPVKGNGSGYGEANDFDCGDLAMPVQLRGTRDPYRLDREGDGWGCE